MAELSENKVRGLIRLVNRGRITPDNIKDEDYKEEVDSRLQES